MIQIKLDHSNKKNNNNVNPLYLFINEINGYIEESNRNKYLILVPTDENKEPLKNIKIYGTKLEILLDQ